MSASKTAWTYRTSHANAASSVFGSLEPMVALWRAKAPRAGAFPMRSNFDILDFESWWGQLSLAEIHRNPIDVRWILWGTKLVEWWGKDHTNQLISQQPYLGDAWGKIERPYIQRLVDKRMIGFVSGTLKPQNREFLHVDGVYRPLEKDGVVTHILSAYRLRTRDELFVPDATAVHTLWAIQDRAGNLCRSGFSNL